jgi:hypothetical protein
MDSIKLDLKKLSASIRHQTNSVPVQGANQKEVYEKICAEIEKIMEKDCKDSFQVITLDSLTGLEE